MSDESQNILGTRVPDNALHRASLWLEDFKRTRQLGFHSQPREEMAVDMDEFVRTVGIDNKVTGQDLVEGGDFYGNNFVQMIFGKLGIVVMTPAGPIDLQGVMFSVWMDGLQHGAAMTAGLYGLSNEEIEQGVDKPDAG